MPKFKFKVTLPDGTIATRNTDHDYKFVMAIKSEGKLGVPSSWGALGWRAKEPSRELARWVERVNKYHPPGHEYHIVDFRVIPVGGPAGPAIHDEVDEVARRLF